MSKYVRKTEDVYEVQKDYGDGFEGVAPYATFREAKQGKKDYEVNEGGSFRIKLVRVKIEEGQA